MLTIHISTRFKRSFKKLSPAVKQDFAQRLERFMAHPFEPTLGTHKLEGRLETCYAFCLKGGYRVLFDFQDSGNALFIDIGRHDDYAKWAR